MVFYNSIDYYLIIRFNNRLLYMTIVYRIEYVPYFVFRRWGKEKAKEHFTRSNRPLLYRPVTYIVRLAIWCYYHGSYKYLRCCYSLQTFFSIIFCKLLAISDRTKKWLSTWWIDEVIIKLTLKVKKKNSEKYYLLFPSIY